jgi:hypothetical protein
LRGPESSASRRSVGIDINVCEEEKDAMKCVVVGNKQVEVSPEVQRLHKQQLYGCEEEWDVVKCVIE